MIWQIAIAGNAKRCAPDGARARRERRALSLQALVSLSLSLFPRLGSVRAIENTLSTGSRYREKKTVMVVASADEVRKPRGTYYPR